MRNKINIPLILGIFILLLLVAAAVNPGLFTDADPYITNTIIYDAEGHMKMAPHSPGVLPPFGSDELGRNVYSQLVHGAGLTLELVLFSLFFLLLGALPAGIAAGYGERISRWILKVLGSTFSAVPSLIFCIIVLKMPFFKTVSLKHSVLAFAGVIALVELGRLGTMIEQKVRNIFEQPFIEGAIVTGKSPIQIIFQNVLPHLIPSLLVFISLEASRILFLLCQMAVFGVVVGSPSFDGDTLGMVGRPMAYEPEWGALVGTSVRRFETYPWIVYPPLAAFFISILGFNMLGEGLKIEFEKKSSHFIARLKKISYLLSPKSLWHDVRRIPKHPVPGITKLIVIAAALLLAFFPRHIFYNAINVQAAVGTATELSLPEYEGRRSGTSGNDKVAQYIASELKAAGLKPGGSEDYFHTFELSEPRMIAEQKLSIKGSDDKWSELRPYKDFKVMNYSNASYQGTVNYKNSSLKDEVQIIQIPGLNANRIYIEMTKFLREKTCRLIVLVSPGEASGKDSELNDLFKDIPTPVIEVSKSVGNKLMQEDINISLEVKTVGAEISKGKNIVAYLPGTDPVLEDQYIVIGASFDGVGSEKNAVIPGTLNNASSVALGIEVAKALAQKGLPKKKIIFAFWDYSNRQESGAHAIDKFADIQGTSDCLYIDLKYLGLKGSNKIIYDSSRIPSQMKGAKRMSEYLLDELAKSGFDVSFSKINSTEAEALKYKGVGGLVIESAGAGNIINTTEDDINAIDINNIKKIGQGLVKALEKMAY